MRKLILAAVAAGSAAGALAVGSGTGTGLADPGVNTLNVVGEPYAKAVAILRAQGVKTVFGGSVGSDLPQAQCVVKSQKVLSASHKMQLDLDCTASAGPQQPATTATAGTQGASGTSGAPATEAARPTAGAPGVVTVVPTPVG
ncbi:MAG: hypothetical protein ACKOQ4_07970 [Mycobacterium sp.]